MLGKHYSSLKLLSVNSRCLIFPGGTICFLTSANAPSFFPNHSFIDKIWWHAQQKSKDFFVGIFQNQTTNMVTSPYRPNQFLKLKRQPGYIHVEYVNTTVNNAPKVKQILRSKLITLTHFKPLVSFKTTWKHQKAKSCLIFSGCIGRDQWDQSKCRMNVQSRELASLKLWNYISQFLPV